MTPNNCNPDTSSNRTNPNTPSERGKTAIIGVALLACVLFATASDKVADRKSPESQISQWRLLAFDDFNESHKDTNNAFSVFNGNRMLGGQDTLVQKLSVPVSQSAYQNMKIVFDYYFIDSWDNEFATLETQIQYADGTSSPKKEIWREAGHAHFFPNTIGGNIYRDYRTTVRVFVDKIDPSKQVSSIDLYFHAYLDSNGMDESWAVDNLEVFGR